MSQLFNGWHLPSRDKYFPKIIQGTPPKSNGFQREHLLEAFKHVKRWRLAVDVGAHVGFWTRDMAEKFEVVFAFEPAEDTFDCLCKNTCDLDNVFCNMNAIGDEVGLCVMNCDEKRPGNTGARFVSKAKGGVSMITLDSFNFPFIDLLKIDVEGFELQVLKGAEELLEEHRPVIIMECKKFVGRYEFGPYESMKFLKDQGYQEVARMSPDRVFIHR